MRKEKKTLPIKLPITEEGSLGLLALGAVGIKAWRKVKQQNGGNKEK